MDGFVFLLVLTAAFTHALWNFFTKKVSGNFTIFWYGLAGTNLLLFFYTVYSTAVSGLNPGALVFIAISAAAHSLYYIAFLYTYKRGDISTAYPIARGTGVTGTAFLSYFILREAISPIAAAGICAVVAGIVLIGLSRSMGQKKDIKTFISALLTGVFIFSYSIADKKGVQLANPVVYINLVDIIAASLLYRLANPKGLRHSFRVIRDNLKETLIIGIGSTGTYIIILFALQMERASYIVAMREFSVVLASVMGFVFLKEKPTLFKILGIAGITAGLLMIKAG